MEQSANAPVMELLDLDCLRGAYRRMDREADDDPRVAAVEAADLLRDVMRAVLEERGIDHAPNEDVVALAARALPALGQHPGAVPEAAQGSVAMTALLGKLAGVPGDLAQIAPLYERGRSLRPRHARLGIAAAGAVGCYLAATHLERPTPGASGVAREAA